MKSRDARSFFCATCGCVDPRNVVNESLSAARHRLKMTHSCGGARGCAWGAALCSEISYGAPLWVVISFREHNLDKRRCEHAR